MNFELTPDVTVDRDAHGRVVQLRHLRGAYSSAMAGLTAPTAAQLAEQYVRAVAPIYALSDEDVQALPEAMTGEPVEEGQRLRRVEEKEILDTTVVSYQQTCCGLPIWNSNLSVSIAGDPPEVVSSSTTLHPKVELAESVSVSELQGFATATPPLTLSDALGIDDSLGEGFSLNGTRLLVYRYDPAERFDFEAGPTGYSEWGGDQLGDPDSAGFDPAAHPSGAGLDTAGDDGDAGDAGPTGPDAVAGAGEAGGLVADEGESAGAASASSSLPFQQGPPTLPLPPVPSELVPGKHYVVREVLFTLSLPNWRDLNWRAFVGLKSGAVLYLRALTAAANCCVFETDPISKTGNLLTAASPASQLDPARTCGLPLQNLDSPSGGTQELKGKFARLQNTDAPVIAAPTTTTPFAFEYSATTDDFSAANAYYHTDWMYRLVEGMGFTISSYFDGTTFPVPVDHRGENGGVNAHAHGNASGNGMGRFRYGLVQSGQPVGIATTLRVCLHEFGHTLLWDHVNGPNFGWAHSAGDTLAVILNDPGSLAPDRFTTFPFVTESSGIDRRHDRDVAAGWAWGGARDDRSYGSEQILSTLMFRIYRVTGGDAADLNTKEFAARYLAYLIIRAIGTLTATTTDPRVFVTALENADELTTNFEGHAGGAWHKLFRWSFEKQGLYQLPGAPTPVTSSGAPPLVDVYIDDGRSGEYEPYLTNIGATPDIWNRVAADGNAGNQDPVAGQANYLYVRVRNRGTSTATNVRVKGYQGAPGSSLIWPTDWSPLTTAELPTGSIASGGDSVVGPFQWTPTQAGQVNVLMSASATGDPSNADTVNDPISNVRLVPLDNNVAQRDFTATVGSLSCVSIKIGSGSTQPGATNWKPYFGTGVYVDIDTSSCKFTTTPRYFTTIEGRSSHWATTGATSIYRPKPTGFRVYVRWSNGGSITPGQANSYLWHINWFGVEDG